MHGRTDGRGWMDELLYCAIAWTEHSRSLHPRLLRKGRGKEWGKKRRIRGIPEILMNSEILESSRSVSLPSRILPASRPRSRYISFLYAPPVLVTIFIEWPTSSHPRQRLTLDDTAGSSPLLLFGQSRAFTQWHQEFCTTFWSWISCIKYVGADEETWKYILSVVRNKGPFTNLVISLCIPGTLDVFSCLFLFFFY